MQHTLRCCIWKPPFAVNLQMRIWSSNLKAIFWMSAPVKRSQARRSSRVSDDKCATEPQSASDNCAHPRSDRSATAVNCLKTARPSTETRMQFHSTSVRSRVSDDRCTRPAAEQLFKFQILKEKFKKVRENFQGVAKSMKNSHGFGEFQIQTQTCTAEHVAIPDALMAAMPCARAHAEGRLPSFQRCWNHCQLFQYGLQHHRVRRVAVVWSTALAMVSSNQAVAGKHRPTQKPRSHTQHLDRLQMNTFFFQFCICRMHNICIYMEGLL